MHGLLTTTKRMQCFALRLRVVAVLHGKSVAIILDETTDIRDRSVLNVVTVTGGKPYLIDVVTMQACNSQPRCDPRSHQHQYRVAKYFGSRDRFGSLLQESLEIGVVGGIQRPYTRAVPGAHCHLGWRHLQEVARIWTDHHINIDGEVKLNSSPIYKHVSVMPRQKK